MIKRTSRFEYVFVMIVFIALCSIIIFFTNDIYADNDDVAEYSVKRATGLITVDGRLDETVWLQAEEAPLRNDPSAYRKVEMTACLPKNHCRK